MSEHNLQAQITAAVTFQTLVMERILEDRIAREQAENRFKNQLIKYNRLTNKLDRQCDLHKEHINDLKNEIKHLNQTINSLSNHHGN